MMRNTINQSILQLKTWGKEVPWLKESMEGNLQPLLGMFMQEQAKGVAIQAGWDPETRLGEAFRLVRFGDMEPLFQMMAQPLEGVEQDAPVREDLDIPVESPLDDDLNDQVIPDDIDKKARLMGHHHLCAGAFAGLLAQPTFRLGYASLVDRLNPSPDMLVESIYGYDVFCYQCGYWSVEEGRCFTGWRNKIEKDAAVLRHLSLKPGDVIPLEDLQRLLAERVPYSKLEEFCGPSGQWKCEFYSLGVCQECYADLRQKFGLIAVNINTRRKNDSHHANSSKAGTQPAGKTTDCPWIWVFHRFGRGCGSAMLWPAVRTALGLTYSQLSYIDSIRVIFQTFSGPFWGMLADRYSRNGSW